MTKSLKSEHSINQVNLEHLLKITTQPSYTCYMIGSLQFEREMSSKVYEVNIKQDPSTLYINTAELLNAIDDLEQWSKDIAKLYRSTELVQKINDADKSLIDEHMSMIGTMISRNKNNKIKYYEKSLNSIFDEWTKYHNNYENKNTQINHYKANINGVMGKDKSMDSFNVYIDNLESTFNEKVGRSFKSEAGEFSYLLDYVRHSNNTIRLSTIAIRDTLKPYLDNKYDLRQPMEYLKSKETGNNEISLGILGKDRKTNNFQNVCKYLKDHAIISDIHFNVLRKSQDKDELINLLKDKGYEKIRYYESENCFLLNKDMYKEINNTVSNPSNVIKFKNRAA